ncbi:hypothetical protein EMIT0P176_280056 [Pseudomonas sp. IT-P176]
MAAIDFVYATQPCGSELARDGRKSDAFIQTARVIVDDHRFKPAPTLICGGHRFCVHHPTLWERACSRWSQERRVYPDCTCHR